MNTNFRFLGRVIFLFTIFSTLLCTISPAGALALQYPAAAAESALLADAESGAVLFEQNADTAIEPASTTKIMTVLLVFEAAAHGRISLDDKVTAKQALIDGVMYDSSRVLPYIQNGEVMTVREYLYCILLMSDCVACDMLGDYVCGGNLSDFIALMNSRAVELGCTNTHFVNTHGYPAEGHYTTARSLFLILKEAVKYPDFCEIFGTIKTTIAPTNLSEERKLYNSDWMLWNPEKIKSIYCRYFYPYATGGKTGSSKKTGHCLVSTAERDGKKLICVVTGAKTENVEGIGWTNRSFSETQMLMEWGFANYSYQTVVSSGDAIYSLPVKKGVREDVPLCAASDITVLLPNDADINAVELQYQLLAESADAPVSASDVFGNVSVIYNGTQLSSVALTAVCDVEKAAIIDIDIKDSGKPKKILLLIALSILVVGTAGVILYLMKLRLPTQSRENPVAIIGNDSIIDNELAKVMQRSGENTKRK